MECAVTLNRKTLNERLAVCSWSLQPGSVDDLIAGMREIGLSRVQLALEPLLEPTDGWKDAIKRLNDAGITIVSGMMGCVGEDYTTIESIHKTGGVVPDKTWPASWANMQKAARIASDANIRMIGLHAGFIPNDEFDYVFAKVVKRIGQIAAHFEDFGILVVLETGQERAKTLKTFLEYVSQFNVSVNFDPANMLLYGSGDPIEALKHLMPFVKQIHVKDAKRSGKPGVWGEEVVVGTGEVAWGEFFDVLENGRFTGNLAIEREAGNTRAADIRAGKEYLESLFD
jgi:sugar phosphate isomerase/epimerase